MKTASKKAPAKAAKAVNAKASKPAAKPASKAKPAAATKAAPKAAKPASKPAKATSKPAKETDAQRHARIATEVIGKPPAKPAKKVLGKGVKELVEAPKAAAPAVIPVETKGDSALAFEKLLPGLKLTVLEVSALRDLVKSADGNGWDFAYGDDLPSVPAKSRGGVIASLVQKGVVTHTNNEFNQCYIGDPANNAEHRWICKDLTAFLDSYKPAPEAPAPVAKEEPRPAAGYVSKTGPDSKYHNPDRSTVKGPVAIMRQLCEENWPTGKMTRKQIIAAGMALGVTKNTAMTQFAMWKARYLADEAAAAE